MESAPEPANSTPSTPPARTLPLGKRLLFATLTLLLFFALLEAILALVGIQPAYQSGDPLVGFSSQLPHFIAKRDTTGTEIVTTAPGREALNVQSFPEAKPAGTFRIASLGGSTTYGRPFWDETSFSGWLRAYLPVADSAKKWEVINAGGISYASYRVLTVAEELARYKPDLFVVYVGHNEFLERRTYGDLLDQPEFLTDMRASAFRLRTATLIQRIAGGISRRNEDKPIVMDNEVARIPINAIGPEAYKRDDAFKEQVITHFRLSLNRILDVAERSGSAVILISPASNYQHMAPFKSEHLAGLGQAQLDHWRLQYTEAMSALRTGNDSEARTHLEACLAIDPRHAASHYHLGRALVNLARHKEAKTSFARAIEEDICPLRAIKPTLSTLEEVAAERNIPLVNAQAILESHSKHGITGNNFFHDHLHLSIEANRLLAVEIIGVMEERELCAPRWSPSAREAATRQVHSGLDRSRYGRELCKLAYAMNAFEQEDMASASVREALAMAPDDQEVVDYALSFHAQREQFDEVAKLLEKRSRNTPTDRKSLGALADAYSKQQKFTAAAATLERLRSLEPENVNILQQLAIACSHAGQHERAVEHLREAARLNPRSSRVQNNLGLVLAKSGQHELATRHYEAAVALLPSLASAHYNWALSLTALGQKEDAIRKLTRVLELKPDHLGATEQLAKLRREP